MLHAGRGAAGVVPLDLADDLPGREEHVGEADVRVDEVVVAHVLEVREVLEVVDDVEVLDARDGPVEVVGVAQGRVVLGGEVPVLLVDPGEADFLVEAHLAEAEVDSLDPLVAKARAEAEAVLEIHDPVELVLAELQQTRC